MAHRRKKTLRYRTYSPEELDELSKMEFNLSKTQFMKHFKKAGGTEHMGDHIWNKFYYHDHSFLGMFGYLDTENQKLTAKALNSIMKEREAKRKEFMEREKLRDK